MNRSICVFAFLIVVAGCGGTHSNPAAGSSETVAASRSVAPTSWFEEVTAARGLPPPTADWPDGTLATPEGTPGGVAFFDYDNDGRLDILQICHGRPGHFDETVPNRLFHQEPDGTFREVPNAGGLNGPGYSMGVAIGDYNNDGLPDVFITRFGHCSLYRNNGNGTFTDVTAQAGLATDKGYWCSSAAWVDYDRDGWLDLFVARYAEYDPSIHCPGDDGAPDYCGPSQYQGQGGRLYHNNRDGTFTDVTEKAGLNVPDRGLGVVCADFTGDGWPDIFVANDEERQNLWINQHDGTFKDEALERGVALSGAGNVEHGMGIAIGDITSDGRLSLFITHFRNEKNTVYMPVGGGLFADKSMAAGMAPIDLPYTGWGCGFADFDNDGNLDVGLVNGRVSREPADPRAKLGKFWNGYAESNLLFRGDGHGHFTDLTPQGGDFTRHVECTRGLAFGDFENNGRIGMVSNTLDNTLRLYRNTAPTGSNHWLSVRALTGKRDALGARLELRAGEHRWTQLVLSAYSYLSSSDPRAHFGLGAVQHVDSLKVVWPDGTVEEFDVPGVDRQMTIRQGEAGKNGSPAPSR
jgi:enediyne biosynthesis protein E4